MLECYIGYIKEAAGYSLDIESDSSGDPVEVLFHDKGLIVLCILYLTVMFMALYL